jgi:hypothetical protein
MALIYYEGVDLFTEATCNVPHALVDIKGISDLQFPFYTPIKQRLCSDRVCL